MHTPTATGNPLSIGHVSLEAVRSLLAPHEAPCLSLYMPTHRRVPDNRVDLPAFSHLVDAFEMALSASHPRREIERLLEPFHALEVDARFWQHVRDGLAVLAADGHAEVFLLQRPVKPLAMATARFHTMPLLRIAASTQRLNVLALTSRLATVYEGTAAEGTIERLDPIPLDGTPGGAAGQVTRDSLIDTETLEPHRVRRGLGGRGLGDGGIVHGGAGSRRDDTDADTEIFFRAVDEIVHERVSKRSGLPLVLVALPRLAADFRRLSKNRLLLEAQVATDAHLLSGHDLAPLVAPVFEAARAARIGREVNAFLEARAHGRAADDLSDVAREAAAGRVAMLLVEQDRFELGWFDSATGAVAGNGPAPVDQSRGGDEPAVAAGDLFGSVAETVILHGGDILAVDRNAMPTESGVAAIYRY